MDAKEAGELEVGQWVMRDGDCLDAGRVHFHNHVGTRVWIVWNHGMDDWYRYEDMRKVEKRYINENEKEAVEFIEGWGHYATGLLRKLKRLNLTAVQVAGVLEVIDTTCNGCWDTDTSGWDMCYCENDE